MLDGISKRARPAGAEIRAHDHLRRSPRRFGGPAGFKEWHHVLVETEDLSLLVNFNLTDDMWSVNPPREEVARMILLARVPDGRGWRGDAERFEPAQVEIRAGSVDARFADNRFEFDGEVYRVAAALHRGDIRVELELRPQLRPQMFGNQRLGAHGNLSWFLVPRLTASGLVHVDGRTRALAQAPAYHDHNWGHYLWGDDFVWEWSWGCGATDQGPWSVVFWRLADGHRTRASSCGVLLELPGCGLQSFVDAEIRVIGEGLYRAKQALALPRVMAMLSPQAQAEIPERIGLELARGDVRASIWFRPEELMRIIVPNETDDDGITTLNETSGHYQLTATIAGRELTGEGRGVFELLRA